MIAVLRLSCVGLCLVVPLAAQDAAQGAAPPAPAPLFVEVDGLPDTVWLQQPLELIVRIGFDSAWLQASGVPLFQQRLDQPFHVVVPWLIAAEDRAVELVQFRGEPTQQVAVGDRVAACRVAGRRTADGRTYDLLELRCRWLPIAAGRSVVAPVRVRYAYATTFDENFLAGRQPLDRQEATVQSAARELVVNALPSGAPPGFHGAVGTFIVRASSAATTVAAGSTFALVIEVTGTGNLERFAPLPPPRLPSFHVQGVVDERSATARRFVLDVLALRAGALEVPAVPFVAFDPAVPGWVTLAAGPVPLAVTGAPVDAPLPPRVRELIDADARAVAAAAAPSWWWYALFTVVALAAAAAARVQRGVRARRRARVASRQRLAEALAGEPAAAVAAFDDCLAAALGVHAWPGADGFAALGRAGVPAALLAELQQVHAQLDGVRFGGEVPAPVVVLAAIARLHEDRGSP